MGAADDLKLIHQLSQRKPFQGKERNTASLLVATQGIPPSLGERLAAYSDLKPERRSLEELKNGANPKAELSKLVKSHLKYRSERSLKISHRLNQ